MSAALPIHSICPQGPHSGLVGWVCLSQRGLSPHRSCAGASVHVVCAHISSGVVTCHPSCVVALLRELQLCPGPPSVSRVFKDSGGSHASPHAHGHHPVGPGEGDTQVGWRLGRQALAGKAERTPDLRVCGPQPAPQARTKGDRCLLQARIPCLLSLEHVGVRTPPPDAPTGPASPLPAALQLVEQRDDLSSPRAAQRVAQGHCTPQRVHLLKGEFQLLHAVHSLGGGGASAVDPSLVPFALRPLAPTGGPRPHCKTKAHLTGKGLVDLKDVHIIHGQPCRPGGKT